MWPPGCRIPWLGRCFKTQSQDCGYHGHTKELSSTTLNTQGLLFIPLSAPKHIHTHLCTLTHMHDTHMKAHIMYLHIPHPNHTHTHIPLRTSYTCTQTHMHTHTHTQTPSHTHSCTHTSSASLLLLHVVPPRYSLSSVGSGPPCGPRDAGCWWHGLNLLGVPHMTRTLSHQLASALLQEDRGICVFEMQSGLSTVLQGRSRSGKVAHLLGPVPGSASCQPTLECPYPPGLLSPQAHPSTCYFSFPRNIAGEANLLLGLGCLVPTGSHPNSWLEGSLKSHVPALSAPVDSGNGITSAVFTSVSRGHGLKLRN